MTIAPTLPAGCIARVNLLLGKGRRTLLGLAGPPGAGKSTLALAIRDHCPDVSQIVPMDGFHLAQCELDRLGLASRKGAPETFDSAGYVALLRRLRNQDAHEIVYAPMFRRDLEEPLGSAVAVHPHTQLVITEGNYLLLESNHWADVPGLLDDVWYVDVERDLRIQRLTRRHEEFGRTPREADDWVAATDEPNARLVASSRERAHFLFHWETR